MTPDEQRMQDEAISFARSHKKAIARRRTDRAIYPSEQDPVSVFMAGSPGAGKTEASIALVNLFADTAILRIDPEGMWSDHCARDDSCRSSTSTKIRSSHGILSKPVKQPKEEESGQSTSSISI